MPEDMRFLIRDYPREAWPDHPNFAKSIENWMGAHLMFRKLSQLVTEETELYLEKSREGGAYAERLGHYGNLLVRNLHGHHHWEDRSFFPELLRADERFSAGLDTLEADHVEMDELLDRLTRKGNRVVKLMQLDETQAFEEAKALHDDGRAIEVFLERHLTDEEELVVPLLLHHKLRG